MGNGGGKGLLSRLIGRRPRDPYWDLFINRPLADPKNDLTPTILDAPEGSVFSVKTELPDPAGMSHGIKGIGKFFGADLVGIAALDPAHLLPQGAGTPDADGAGDAQAQSDELTRKFPFAIVCAVHTEYDPSTAQGIGGRLGVQEAALVNFKLRAYIRELGYVATIGGASPMAVAVAAGLGKLGEDGRFIATKYGARVCLTDPLLTDLPLTSDAPPK